MKDKSWKKWRGKKKIIERKTTIPKEEDKLSWKLKEVERKIQEYNKKKEEQLERRHRKKKDWKERNRMIVEDTWGMLRWLTQYIEQNEYDWARRKEMEEKEVNEEYKRWAGMSEEEMIQIMKKEEDNERKVQESRKERAERRRGYWKDRRVTDKGKEVEKYERPEDKVEMDRKNLLDERKKSAKEMQERRKIWAEEKEKKIK